MIIERKCWIVIYSLVYQIKLFMSKVKQKELDKIKAELQKKQQQYENALKKLIHSEQTLQITLNYCEQYLKQPLQQSLEEYSPIHISRMIFEKQLQMVKSTMLKMPQQNCRIEHFIVMMMKVMKFPFQKAPFYMVGLKDMFREIVKEGKDTITYDQIFNYVVGEVVIMKEQDQHTQFHIQFFQKKKQDYLLHDNGIKKVYFSNDLKLVLSLDNRQNMIKIYDQDMRNVTRFAAKKQLHNGRIPQIIDFDYSQMTMRLGIIFADGIIESIHLPNFVNKSQSQFEALSLNEIIFPLPKPMKKLYYIQMSNRWLTFSDQLDELYLFDMEKVRLKPQEVEQRITLDTNEMPINQILEVVSLSLICVVYGNQISFFSQTFKKQEVVKYSHHDTISILKYCEDNNTFYMCGSIEKTITMFTIARSKKSFKVWTRSINKVIIDFEVFPFYDTILLTDEDHNLRLVQQSTWTPCKEQSYAHIVKNDKDFIKCYKIGKGQFIVYQTYMIGLDQEKVAIEKEIQFNYLPYWYYDQKKQQFYLSVNDQLIAFSVPFGQIRKNFTVDSSNLQKHQCFFLGKHTHPFIFDSDKNIYELYMKSEQLQGQNKMYRKRVPLPNPVAYFYDQDMRNIMVINANTIVQTRNDFHNNFTSINTIHLKNIPKIISARFCKHTKYLTLLTSDHLIYQLKNYQSHLSKGFKVQFGKQKRDEIGGVIVDYCYCSQMQIIIILNSNKQLYFFQRLNPSNQLMIKLDDCLPYKLKQLNFNKFQFSISKDRGTYAQHLTLTDDSGFLLDLRIQKLIVSKFGNSKKQDKQSKSFQKEPYQINASFVTVEHVLLNQSNKVKLSNEQFYFLKAHNKKIVIVTKFRLEVNVMITFSQDGTIKLWNSNYDTLFSLKLPNLLKYSWNMKEIHSIKNNKSIKQINEIIKKHYSGKKEQTKPVESINMNKKFKQSTELPKKFKFQEDLPLEIDSKEVEDLVLKEQDYYQQYLNSKRILRPKVRYNPQLTTIDVHPWRTKKQFKKIFERASPVNKYSTSMPRDLISLRTSLDMTEKKKKTIDYSPAQTILPQLKTYQSEDSARNSAPKKKPKLDEDEQQFESCVFVKTEKPKKRLNQLDQIDRQFRRKLIEMRNRKVVTLFREEKKNQPVDAQESTLVPYEGTSEDTIRDIQSVFDQHNKEASQTRKGRVIRIPKIAPFMEYTD